MRAIFGDDPGASVGLSNKLPVMVGSVPSLPVSVRQARIEKPSAPVRGPSSLGPPMKRRQGLAGWVGGPPLV